jgi:hypothetical protein
MDEQEVEEWRKVRWLGWIAMVSERGASKIPSPKALMKLPGDDDERNNVKREDFEHLFDLLK